jgi:hypothetical protein
MATVECEIEEADVTAENGMIVDGVVATCSACGHVTESFGTGDASRRRCLVLMREECPRNERNYYVDSDEQ